MDMDDKKINALIDAFAKKKKQAGRTINLKRSDEHEKIISITQASRHDGLGRRYRIAVVGVWRSPPN